MRIAENARLGPHRISSGRFLWSEPHADPRSRRDARTRGFAGRRARKWRFLLGQNAQGLWVIRECAGAKAGLFLTREAALRFARLECFEDDYAVIQLSEGLEFDYAA